MTYLFKLPVAAGIVFTILTANVYALDHWEKEKLLEASTTVIVGEVVSIHQTLDETKAQVRVENVIKGSLKADSIVSVISRWGKVNIEPDEPRFTHTQTAIFFLTAPEDERFFVCTNMADGYKVIRNNNVYPFHDNALISEKVKDYLGSLSKLAKV